MSQRILFPAALAALALIGAACQPGGDGGAGVPAAPVAQTAPSESADAGEVAARIEGVAISNGEIDARAREELFKAQASTPSKLYELRSQTLGAMLDERLLAVLAEKRGLDPDALVAAEIEAMGAVQEEEAAAFFAENQARMGDGEYEEVKGQILDFLAGRREFDAVERLREGADIEILIQPPRVEVAATGPSRGPEDAKVTIVEFSDFQCPYCQRVTPTIDAITERYPNDVRIVYRNFPLRNHSRAQPAAEAALCADDQGKFWPYHDLLFANPRALDDANLASYAETAGLDNEAFSACYDERRFAAQVNRDAAEGRAAGVTGTPAFFVNGVMLSGAKPPEAFFEIIEAELARN
jgi:predicted DsbA family dithiol-disulfide isomerase